jgi:hypothetical protein
MQQAVKPLSGKCGVDGNGERRDHGLAKKRRAGFGKIDPPGGPPWVSGAVAYSTQVSNPIFSFSRGL